MCPDDSNGIYNVPNGTLVNSGDTVLPSQHNPWATDSSAAISNRFSKDGRAPATGNWNLNTFRITNIGAPVANGDAVNKQYADSTYATQTNLSLKLDILQPSVDVASAATTDIGAAASQNIRITGTTTITSLGTSPSGTFRRVVFSGSLTLTHNSTSLILPGSANVITIAGDVAEFVSLGSGNWRCVQYTKFSNPSGGWLSSKYESPEQSITSAGSLTLAHGLVSEPNLVIFVLICKTAEQGYSVNDKLYLGPVGTASSLNDNYAFVTTIDATNINIRFGSNVNVFSLLNKGTGAANVLTNANWRLVVRAFF